MQCLTMTILNMWAVWDISEWHKTEFCDIFKVTTFVLKQLRFLLKVLYQFTPE